MDNTVTLKVVVPPAAARPESPASGKDLPKSGDKLPPESAPKPPPDSVEKAVQHIQRYLSSSQRQLQFEVDTDSGRTVVRVVNPETGELIRQIPGDEILKLARTMGTNGGLIISDLV